VVARLKPRMAAWRRHLQVKASRRRGPKLASAQTWVRGASPKRT
jgi:hypothetical protein